MLENSVCSQLQQLQPAMFFQQDSAPPNWTLIVRASLNQRFPD
jgi:hypothetical protein